MRWVLGAGDEVITTPFTYIAPAESIHHVGAKIVFRGHSSAHLERRSGGGGQENHATHEGDYSRFTSSARLRR
jgi:hypothetical protein